MTSNYKSNGTDLDSLFAAHVTNNAANLVNYKVSGVDIQARFDPLSNPDQSNVGSRIPAINITTSSSGWSASTDLSTIFCGNAGQYSLTGSSSASTVAFTSPVTISNTIIVTFSNAAALTNYFYYGGRIQLYCSHTGGSTAADAALATMFSNMGTIVIYDQGHFQAGGISGTITNGSVGGSNIGTTSVSLYNISDGSPYSSTTYNISMIADAAAGSATRLTIILTLNVITAGSVIDNYTGTYTSYVQQRNHPSQSVPTISNSFGDPYFSDVKLLMHFDTINGLGNGSSQVTPDYSLLSNSFSMIGSASLSSVQSKFGGKSLLLAGASWVQAPYNKNIVGTLGAGDFTVELWVYPTVNNGMIIDAGYAAAANWQFYMTSSGNLAWWDVSGVVLTTPSTVPLNTWSFVTAVRSSGILTLYINGNSSGTVALSRNYNGSGIQIFAIGAQVQNRNASYDWHGYLEEVRITVGVARYTSNFTPSVSAFPTSISDDPYYNSVILLLQFDIAYSGTISSTFIDSSSLSRTLIRNDFPVIQSTVYEFSNASCLFSGTSQQISTNNSTDFNLTGDFTIEGWVNFNSTSSQYFFALTQTIFSGSTTIWFEISSGILSAYVFGSYINGPSISTGTWYYLALVRAGTNNTFYVNGVSQGTNSLSITPTGSSIVYLGGAGSISPSYLNGYLDEWRITVGTARYLSNFTPPTTPFFDNTSSDPYYSSVKLLMHFDGTVGSTTFVDNSSLAISSFTASGIASLDNGFSQFGPTALKLNTILSTNAYISTTSNLGLGIFGTNDFTVESWVYSYDSANGIIIDYGYSAIIGGTNGWQISINGGHLGWWKSGVQLIITTSSISMNAWNHVAAVRSGGILNLYINGVSSGIPVSDSTNYNSTGVTICAIGAQVQTRNTLYDWHGYIDELRITAGVARYTSNFTPSLTPFPNH